MGRPVDVPSGDGNHDDADWLVLVDGEANRVGDLQVKKDTAPYTWPSEDVPMRTWTSGAPPVEDLEQHRKHALRLGARLL